MPLIQMRTLEETQLSASQREELNSLRYQKEPGELMIPPDSSCDEMHRDKDENSTFADKKDLKMKKRSRSAGAYFQNSNGN